MKKRPAKQSVDTLKKVPYFLRVTPTINEWLLKKVETGGATNVQEIITEILRAAREAEQRAA